MAKICTSIEQSKKLADILPIESADNLIVSIGYNDGVKTVTIPKETLDIIKTPFSDIRKTIPCWSLASLLEVLPHGKVLLHDKNGLGYKCICNNIDTDFYDNPIDACYEMIVKLNELELLRL